MKAVRFYLHAALWLLCAGAVAAAEDLPTPESWVPYLRQRKDRVPRCSVEWKVERRMPLRPGEPILSVMLEHRIQVAHTDRERTKLEEERNELDGKTVRIPIAVRLDYYTSDRLFLRQSYRNENGKMVEMEYSLNGDGVVYEEFVGGRTVHLKPLAQAASLRKLLCALPELVLDHELARVADLKVQGTVHSTLHLVTPKQKNGVLLILERDTHRLMTCSIGNMSDLDELGNGLVLPNRTIVFKPAGEDFAYPVPKEVILQDYNPIRQVLHEEIWTPTSLQVQPDPAQMHSPQYVFKPGYQVIDETGEKKREYSSDEVLGKGKPDAAGH